MNFDEIFSSLQKDVYKPSIARGTHQKKFLDNGELNSYYRKRKSGRSGKTSSKFDSARFLAFDGEGKNTGSLIDAQSHEHIYTLLANSDGAYIHNDTGLRTLDIFEFLLSTAEKNCINIIYGGSYDMNMFLRNLPFEKAQEVHKNGSTRWTFYENYAIKFIPRKYFELAEIDPSNPFDDFNNLIYYRKFTLWDVIGFFQSSFLSAIGKWLGTDYIDYNLIQSGKEKRADFSTESKEFILYYNQAELRALILIMEKFRDSMKQVGLKLARWDGAGAVAAAMMQKHEIKKHIKDLPTEIERAAQHAYFGGRIECLKFGTHYGEIHHYDINSAYPAAQFLLPSLTQGEWKKLEPVSLLELRKLPLLSLIHITWNFRPGDILYPFPYRSKLQHKVLFPHSGENWVHLPELQAAIKYIEHTNQSFDTITIHEVFYFDGLETLPFAFIEPYYQERQKLVVEAKKLGKMDGREYVLKLGLNSLYGKTAQKVGFGLKRPSYNNLVYAGFITAYNRAKLFLAALQKPHAIISLCTDGIFSLEPLELETSHKKQLGLWSYEKHSAMISIQSGFYFIRTAELWELFSRGFDKLPNNGIYQKSCESLISQIRFAWQNRMQKINLPCTRFVTLGTALASPEWFPRWCSWHEMADGAILGRALGLSPVGTKRAYSGIEIDLAAEKMLQTFPIENETPEILSEKYHTLWETSDELLELMLDLEINIES